MADQPDKLARRYSREEVEGILQLALRRQNNLAEGLDHGDLVDVAGELGIDCAELEQAIAEQETTRAEMELRDEWKRRRNSALVGGLLTWAIFVAVAVVSAVLSPPGPWFQWLLVPWGAGLLVSAIRVRRGPSDGELERFRLRKERRQRQRELNARRQRRAEVVGKVVEEGASMLLADLAERRRVLRDDGGSTPSIFPRPRGRSGS